MKALGMIGKGALVVVVGALVVLTIVRIMDDRYVDDLWAGLEKVSNNSGQVFSEQMVADLPEPAKRYFVHAIKPGTPLATRVHMVQTGGLKQKGSTDWASFTAQQSLVPGHGFVWKADAQMSGLSLTVRDSYVSGQGRMRIVLGELVPVINASGPDLSRSALGRLAGESMWLPSALLPGEGVKVEGIDEDSFKVTCTIDGEMIPITFTVDSEGRLKESMFPRYGDQTDDGQFQYIPFGCQVEEEGTFGGYTIPTRFSAAWWYGTDLHQETFRFQVESATFG